MMTGFRTARRGFTLLELMAVMAVIVILGGILIPTLSGTRGNTRTKAGADVMQSYIARARAKAMETGRAYRLAISADGKKVQISPDIDDAPHEDDDPNADPITSEDNLPQGVMAVIINVTDDDYVSQDQSGWQRISTFLPDGTCREDTVDVLIEEKGVTPVVIHIRGVTGTATVARGGDSP